LSSKPYRLAPGRRATGTLLLIPLFALLAVPVCPAGTLPSSAWPSHLQGADYVGSEDCMTCHEEIADAHRFGVHGNVLAGQAAGVEVRGCESCHGPGSVHGESYEPDDIVNPATAEPALSSAVCRQCHRSADHDAFPSSLHAMSDVTCTSCHSTHGEQRTNLLAAPETDLCFECHQDMRSKTYLPSHHPVREGRMSCSDCHEPHTGTLRVALAGEPANELCFQCHAGHQGPFIFEHDPVVEDCGICHDPHGAVANSLLRQNEPFLCLQCHQMHFHSQLAGIEGSFTTLDGYSGVSVSDGSKRAMLTKCTQCHSQIHGSDLPSQSITGQGRALTR
jgi:DmsE family decaheme c-type cytochrome